LIGDSEIVKNVNVWLFNTLMTMTEMCTVEYTGRGIEVAMSAIVV
jgi:hypothetical protein